MKTLTISDDKFLLIIQKPPTLVDFIQSANVREGSYAYRIVSHIWNSVFVESIDYAREYLLYYNKEYPAFSRYLKWNVKPLDGFGFDREAEAWGNILKSIDDEYSERICVYFCDRYPSILFGDDGQRILTSILTGCTS